MAQAPKPQSEESSTSLVAQGDGLTNDNAIPQLFTSIPALNEAASYLAQTTSYFTRCFSDHSVEYSPIGSHASAIHAQELVTFPSGETETTSATSRYPSQNAGTLVVSNGAGRSGISMFQSLIERARRTVRGSADDIGWLQRDPEMPPVEDGTARFMEIFDNIRRQLRKMPKR